MEIDAIVYGKSGLHGFEVKNTAHIWPSDLRSLRAFLDDYPVARATFLSRGKETLMRDGILCRPVKDFLRQLRPGDGLEDVGASSVVRHAGERLRSR